MISMTISLVVLGALYAAYSGSAATSRAATAVTQLSEDATIAINLMRTHINLAGYSRGVSANAATLAITRAWSGRAVFGCDGGFEDDSQPINSLACSGSGSADALAVAYEVDNSANGNAMLGANNKPLDCLGNQIDKTEVGAGYYLSYSRFYVSGGSLFCKGPGNPAGQALVENVTDMQIRYGVAEAGNTEVVAYQDASDVADWSTVVSVRMCVVVRSSEPVLDAVTAYQGCDPFASKTTPGDKRLYRSFTSTMVLQNRVG